MTYKLRDYQQKAPDANSFDEEEAEYEEIKE